MRRVWTDILTSLPVDVHTSHGLQRLCEEWTELEQTCVRLYDLLTPLLHADHDRLSWHDTCLAWWAHGCDRIHARRASAQALYQLADEARQGRLPSDVWRRTLLCVRAWNWPLDAVEAQAQSFYTSHGPGDMVDAPFLCRAAQWLANEEAWQAWMPSSQAPALLLHTLVDAHLKAYEQGFTTLLAHPAAMQAWYTLLTAAQQHAWMRHVVRTQMEKHVWHLLTASTDLMCTSLLTCWRIWQARWADSLDQDATLQAAMRDAMEAALPAYAPTVATQLTHNLDTYLRRVTTSYEAHIDTAMHLFRCLPDKDAWEETYRRTLADRLLHDQARSLDAERYVVTQLKHICGPFYTRKLDTMLTDMELSAQWQQAFAERRTAPSSLHVQVLTQAHWPSIPCTPMALPPYMQEALTEYEAMYQAAHTGRTLQWCHDLGTLTLQTKWDDTVVYVHGSTWQAAILLCFNARTECTGTHLQTTTQLPWPVLESTLQTFLRMSTPLLSKTPADTTMRPADTFRLTTHLPTKRRHIRLPSPHTHPSAMPISTTTATPTLVDVDMVLQAAIMRILKASKRASHATLVSRVIEAVQEKVTATPSDVKKAIEKLMDKVCVYDD